ncbi:META domain-containing protein [Roseobacter ponti]|uniref:META domain-containing protein n=1 Tax=Roseobacter ponti TaxID=1891787 RepID=A0A858SMU2_9RHOB|nr:META domain-containing protein [Roseobacter ponti]QJF50144.1 META domain-containing protein [Roseobacter ponti]
MIRTRTTGLVTALMLLAGCYGDETATAYGAAGKTWVLEEIGGTAAAGRTTLLFPEPGTIAGETACNSYSASMTVPYPWFEAGPVATTRRACPADATASEQAYLASLQSMTLIEVLGDTLILTRDDDTSMIFKAGD